MPALPYTARSPPRTAAVHASRGRSGQSWRSGSQVLTSARSAVVPLGGRWRTWFRTGSRRPAPARTCSRRQRLLIDDWAEHLGEERGQVVTLRR